MILSRARRAGTWGFVLLVLAQLGLLAPLVLYRRLEWSYPFLGGDGAEWLGQGLAMFGADVRVTGRQPLLPLVAGLLDRAEALRFLPWFSLAVAALLELILFFLLRRLHGLAVAWACGLYLLLHHAVLESSVQVMADLPAVLLTTLAVSCFLAREESRWRSVAAVAFGAAAVLAQQVALVPLGAVWGWDALRRRKERGSVWRVTREDGWTVLSLAAVALPNLLWQVWVRRPGGGGALMPQAQWSYLRPHAGALDHSLALLLAFFGLPALGLVVWEAVRRVRGRGPADGERAAWAGAALAWLAVTGAFLFFLYDYRASRYFLYLLPPFVLLLGERLAALRKRPTLFGLAALAAIAGGAWTQGPGPARTGLWPLPPLELVAGEEGEDDPPLQPGLEGTSYPELVRRSLPHRALAAARERAEAEPPTVPGLDSVRNVVVLYGEGTEAGGRYELRDRVGLTFRRRAKLAPCSLFPPPWRGWDELQEVARSGGLRFLRGGAPGEPSPWLLVAPEECVPREPARTGRPPEMSSAEAPSLDTPEWVREVERRLSGPDGFVAVVPEGEGGKVAARALALALRTTNFFVLDRAVAESLPRTVQAEERLGPYRLLRARYRRWPVVLLLPNRSPG